MNVFSNFVLTAFSAVSLADNALSMPLTIVFSAAFYVFVILVLVIMDSADKNKKKNCTEPVIGKVAEVFKTYCSRGGESGYYYEEIFEYTYNNVTYTRKADDSNSGFIRPVGTKWKLYVNPYNPKEFYAPNWTKNCSRFTSVSMFSLPLFIVISILLGIEQDISLGSIIVPVVIYSVLFIFLSPLVKLMWKRNRYSAKVEATVVKVIPYMNRRQEYRYADVYKYIYDGKVYIQQSKELLKRSSEIGDSKQIYIDPYEPEEIYSRNGKEYIQQPKDLLKKSSVTEESKQIYTDHHDTEGIYYRKRMSDKKVDDGLDGIRIFGGIITILFILLIIIFIVKP